MPAYVISSDIFQANRNASIFLRSGPTGRPRLASTIWQSLKGTNYSSSYLRAKLAAIERFYQYTEATQPSPHLDYLVISQDCIALEGLLMGFLATLQNEAAISDRDLSAAWQNTVKFVVETLNFLMPITHASNLKELQVSLRRLERMYVFLRPLRNVRPTKIRALPAVVVEELYALVTPGSSRNPFRATRLQFRNYVIFLLLLHLGLRKSELLSLRADAVRHEYDPREKRDRFWLDIVPPDIHDPRKRTPSLKNQGAVRQLPLSDTVARTLYDYIANWRRRCAHGFLLDSGHKKPLSLRSVSYVIEHLSKSLSRASQKALQQQNAKQSVSLHDFRHTCAVIRLRNFLDQGSEMSEAEALMRAFFGWSRDSTMPRLYAKAYYDERLHGVWDASFDRRIEIIRNSAIGTAF